MTGGDWIEPNPYRASWLFLLLARKDRAVESQLLDQSIEYWEIATGNPDELVEITAEHEDDPSLSSNQELQNRLLDTLEQHRYQDTVLLTPDVATLQILRVLLSESDVDEPTLRGFNNVVIDPTLSQYFGIGLDAYSLNRDAWIAPMISEREEAEVQASDTPRRFWELWTQVYRLLPPTALEGDPI